MGEGDPTGGRDAVISPPQLPQRDDVKNAVAMVIGIIGGIAFISMLVILLWRSGAFRL